MGRLSAVFSWFMSLSLIKKGLVVIVVLGLLGFSGMKVFGQQAQKVQYQTATVEKGTLVSTITASGTIITASSASITSSATGVVKKVYVQNGDTVKQGDKIADISLDENSEQKQAAAWASYLAAQNSLNAAKAKMNSLQSALFTANKKFVNGAGTANPIVDDPTYIIQRADWLQAESDYNNQQGVISQAQASLTSASLVYSQTSGTVTAPMSGTVSNLTFTEGLSIGGTSSSSNNSSSNNSSNNAATSQSYGSIVLEGGQTQAVVNLTEIDVTKAAVGQKVTITMDAFPDKTFTGKVTAINTNGSVSSGVTTYPTTIVFDSAPDNAYPNMAVNAQIITDIRSDVVLVPNAAVQTANGQSTVRVLRDGKEQTVPVEVGNANDTQTEIVSGINEGDVVITGTVSSTSSGSRSQSGTASPFGAGLGGRNAGFGGGGGGVFIRSGAGR